SPAVPASAAATAGTTSAAGGGASAGDSAGDGASAATDGTATGGTGDSLGGAGTADDGDRLINGLRWLDVDDKPILGNEGNVLKAGDQYYLFGTRDALSGGFAAVSVYRSADLRHWAFDRDVLTQDSDEALGFAYIYRPNVIFNAATGKYVMWMRHEVDIYNFQRAAVAVSDTPDGDYRFVGTFRPLHDQGIWDPSDPDRQLSGYTSRNCTAFVDDDGKAYFVSVSNGANDLNLYQLTDDYLEIDHLVATLFPGKRRDAPVLFKRNGVYFMLSIGSQVSDYPVAFATSTSLASGWSDFSSIDSSPIVRHDMYEPPLSTPAAVLSVPGSAGPSLLYIGDSVDYGYVGQAHVWLPISFPANDQLSMPFYDLLDLDATQGKIAGSTRSFRFISDKTGLALDVDGASLVAGARLVQARPSGAKSQIWFPEFAGGGAYRLTNANSGKLLGSDVAEELHDFVFEQVDKDGHDGDVLSLVPRQGAHFSLYHDKLSSYAGVEDGSAEGAPIKVFASGQAKAAGTWHVEFVR
ncbi:MAG TPA: family 43 glycosylhydrolase, partial [Polyangiaceae bacterium]